MGGSAQRETVFNGQFPEITGEDNLTVFLFLLRESEVP